MSDLDLLVPAIAVVALFGVVGLIVQSIRQGRAIRRVEDLLRESGGAASEASLDRIRQLQTRANVSSGVRRGTGPAITIAALLGVAVLAGGAWFALSGGSDDPSADGGDSPAATAATTTDTTTETDPGTTTSETDAGETNGEDEPSAPSDGSIPDEVLPLDNKAEVTVAIFNASGVQGAAGVKTRGLLEAQGYSIGTIGNSPDGTADLAQTQIMYGDGNENIAWNVARDLDVDLAVPLDGLTSGQLGAADVAILVGGDLANRP